MARTEDDNTLEAVFLAEVQRSQRLFLAEPQTEVAKRNFKDALAMFSDLVLNRRVKIILSAPVTVSEPVSPKPVHP
jgi:hypothetical protein